MRARHVIAAVALLFFALPIGARLVGVKAKPFENHSFAGRPALSDGWDAFPQTTRFFTDRMPLRQQAVTANKRISESVFGTTPSYGTSTVAGTAPPKSDRPQGALSRVTDGKNGWLYLTQSMNNACAEKRRYPINDAIATWLRMARVLRSQGKNVVLVVPPDKDTIYPEFLPDEFGAKDCLPQDRNALWRKLDAAERPGFIPMRDIMVRARETHRDLIYLRKDAHWSDIGASYVVRSVLGRVGGGVRMLDSELRYSHEDYVGDLTVLENDTTKDVRPTITVERAPGAAKVPGTTVMLGDSFGTRALDLLNPYFDRLETVQWDGAADVVRLDAIKRADTVILETVERYFTGRTGEVRRVTRQVQGRD
jgi:alginate O-acetyltransferase complex protein AlgJ